MKNTDYATMEKILATYDKYDQAYWEHPESLSNYSEHVTRGDRYMSEHKGVTDEFTRFYWDTRLDLLTSDHQVASFMYAIEELNLM